MRDFLLVLDTEASGLPKKWDLPYSKNDNWPHAVQVSWLIYDKTHRLVKEENHYIKDTGFTISSSSIKIHGITHDFLQQHGEDRSHVMQLLHDDILAYQPLIAGHFVELDMHITGAAFYRSGLDNPFTEMPCYCTMLGTTALNRNPQIKYLRLGDLYSILFQQPLENQHNSLADARATAACFFELQRRGDITDESIAAQLNDINKAKRDVKKAGLAMIVLFVFLVTLLIACTI
ncbi:3'-5' exonuclease [Deminuibacter soli]|uniref:3'-5' exonuclease n=1 Tax=Deminuibacter soli TaxID=2291815 RepID=A0A3E1NKE4_9BACT|nr:3'-5' exonuclease [Deminuibacter soli]RFM28351.1 3'-5' exonuclease [Deminuibacter soli]